MKKGNLVLGIAVLAMVSTALPGWAEAAEPAVGPTPATGAGVCGDGAADTVPAPVFLGGRCMFCESSPATFNPQFGVICNYAGTCEKGQDACCHYTCQCGVGNGDDPVPEDACTPLNDPGCCAGGGGPPLCEVSYCDSEGVRCIANGCGVGCCLYGCQPDPTCTAPDPIPSTAC